MDFAKKMAKIASQAGWASLAAMAGITPDVALLVAKNIPHVLDQVDRDITIHQPRISIFR